MPERIYIETRKGRPHFVVDHGHSGTRHETVKITRGELHNMRERERFLVEEKDRLRAENYALKYNLQVAENDLQHHRTWNLQLQGETTAFRIENADLRQALESAASGHEDRHKRELRELQHKYKEKKGENEALKTENEGLVVRIRDLSRQVNELSRTARDAVDSRITRLTEDVRKWKWNHDDVQRRAVRLRENLDAYRDDNARLVMENDVLARDNAAYRRNLARRGVL